jgi:hypothetical protein
MLISPRARKMPMPTELLGGYRKLATKDCCNETRRISPEYASRREMEVLTGYWAANIIDVRGSGEYYETETYGDFQDLIYGVISRMVDGQKFAVVELQVTTEEAFAGITLRFFFLFEEGLGMIVEGHEQIITLH